MQRLGAGTGSENMLRYYCLVGPNDSHNDSSCYDRIADYHIIEIKQQRAAAPLHYFSNLSPVNQLNPAHLTVDCQRLMQRHADLVLDEINWQGKHWLLRSRHHAAVGIAPEDIALSTNNVGEAMNQYARACGYTLALAHARGDRRSTHFEAAAVKTLPSHSNKLIAISQGYAQQVIKDHQRLQSFLTTSSTVLAASISQNNNNQ